METWKDIPGFEGYYKVSSHGRVRSLERITILNYKSCVSMRVTRQRILKHRLSRGGYWEVTLNKNNRATHPLTHQLIARAFIGPKPIDKEVRHLDGNPQNNKYPENICYGTRQENADDRVRMGTQLRGEKIAQSILKERDVLLIRKYLRDGASRRMIAEHLDISQHLVGDIYRKRNWAWL